MLIIGIITLPALPRALAASGSNRLRGEIQVIGSACLRTFASSPPNVVQRDSPLT